MTRAGVLRVSKPPSERIYHDFHKRRAALWRRCRRAYPMYEVVVSHLPPFGVLDQSVRYSPTGAPVSIGSHAVADLTQRGSNVLVCCGHSHRMGGRHQPIGRRCVIVNAASHDDLGAPARVADITLRAFKRPVVRWHEVRLPLGLDAMPELGLRRANSLVTRGIRDTAALARSRPRTVSAGLGYNPRACLRFLAMARAWESARPVVYAPVALPRGPRVLLDIETDLRQQAIWIVGLLDEATGEFRHLIARRDDDEPPCCAPSKPSSQAAGDRSSAGPALASTSGYSARATSGTASDHPECCSMPPTP
jgi:hypothetical protein